MQTFCSFNFPLVHFNKPQLFENQNKTSVVGNLSEKGHTEDERLITGDIAHASFAVPVGLIETKCVSFDGWQK